MNTTRCTHQAARELLSAEDPVGTLRIVGPMLEDNPSDLNAWRIGARALLQTGDQAGAVKNLKSAALAMAQEGNPIQAIEAAKEVEALGVDIGDVLGKLSTLYGAGSTRVMEADLAPPPLPAGQATELWGSEVESGQVISRAGDAMAMAWGAAMMLEEKGAQLPYVPLLSALDPEDFVQLVASLERVVVEDGQVVVEQGSRGDAMFIVTEGSVQVSQLIASGDPIELARLGPGAFFGEMALVSSVPRAAQVSATEKTVLLRADKVEMESLAGRAPAIGDVLIAFCHARMLENLMRVSPVLAPVPTTKRPEVIARFGTDYLESGTTIIQEGEEGPGLFLIVSGRVRVERRDGDDSVVLAKLGAGDLFGEISLLMRKPSTASVIADQNTALLVLPRREFEAVTAQFPELLKGAYDIAIERETQNHSIMGKVAEDASDMILV